MALTPSLLKELKASVSVGLIATVGLLSITDSNIKSPAQATASIAGLVPSISVVTGPVSQPDQAALTVNQLVPSLALIYRITTGLPDESPDENDLTPVLVWGDFVAVSVGAVTMRGLAPAVVGNTGQFIAVPVGSAVVGGLIPVISTAAGQSGFVEVIRGVVSLDGLAPGMSLEMKSAMDVGGVTLTGLEPTLLVRYGWQTVALAGQQTWEDVPRI
jgi:hypothetical protein